VAKAASINVAGIFLQDTVGIERIFVIIAKINTGELFVKTLS
jgi:hypothetical protein